jgi:hypothetical protein
LYFFSLRSWRVIFFLVRWIFWEVMGLEWQRYWTLLLEVSRKRGWCVHHLLLMLSFRFVNFQVT